MQHNSTLESDLTYSKLAPQALDMESNVLGACMLEVDALDEVLNIIPESGYFYKKENQFVFGALKRMRERGSQIDISLLTQDLLKHGELDNAGGAYEVTQLAMSVVTSAHVTYHARVISEKYMQRRLIEVCGFLINQAYKPEVDIFDLLESGQKAVSAIADGVSQENAVPVGDVFMDVLMDIEEMANAQTDVIGIPSRYVDLDKLTLGWQKTDLVVLAARPSQGKTALGLNLSMNAATFEHPVLFFSLESSKKSLVRRLAAAKSNIPLEDIRKGTLTNQQKGHLQAHIQFFNSLPVKIDDKSRKLSTIRNAVRKWRKRQKNAEKGMIVIDYLQLMSVEGKGSREQEVASLSRDLKELAMELEIPIIALSQLNRAVETQTNKKPNLSNLRESGAIEQDANVIMFIWWDQRQDGGADTYLLVEKNRDGKCGDVKLKFNGDIQKWLNYDDINQSQSDLPSFIKHNFQTRNPSEPARSWEDEF